MANAARKTNPIGRGNRGVDVAGRGFGALPAEGEAQEGASNDRADLAHSDRRERHEDESQNRDRRPRPVGRKRPRHAEHGLGDDGDGDEFQAMQTGPRPWAREARPPHMRRMSSRPPTAG